MSCKAHEDRSGSPLLIVTGMISLLLAALTAAGPAGAQSPLELEPTRPVRIIVLDFSIMGSTGAALTPREEADLSRLAELMPPALSSRLVPLERFEVLDPELLRDPLRDLALESADTDAQRARRLLESGIVDQVVVGSIGAVQATVVVSAQRYGLREGEMVLLGRTAAQAPRLADATVTVVPMLNDLFRPADQVIPRTIEQVFLIPGTLRVPVGQSRPLSPVALDNQGQPVSPIDYIYQSNDTSRVTVDQHGNVTGVSPGQAVITVRTAGQPVRGNPIATSTVTVVPPSFAFLVGGHWTGAPTEGLPVSLGIRLTPSVPPRAPPRADVPRDLEATASNPLAFLTNFFSSLLAEGLITIDLDIEPGRNLLFTLSAVQRTRSGYFGTGVGFVTPTGDSGLQGVHLRLTVGREVWELSQRAHVPVEINLDLVFQSGTFEPVVRIGVSSGITLFQ